jgi:predicted 3-demethylubiquinone-9 3-methyltransferase (glyoxalase superfamily)
MGQAKRDVKGQSSTPHFPSMASSSWLWRAKRNIHLRSLLPISFFVNCETQAEVDDLWKKLSEEGETEQCGWLKDKLGVSWQIVPNVLAEMLQDKDPENRKK